MVKNVLGMKGIYILMLSAESDRRLISRRAKDVGADIYMTKPFDPEEILEKVVEVLEIDM